MTQKQMNNNNNNPTYQQPLCTSGATSIGPNTATTRQRHGNETITTTNDTVRLVPQLRFPEFHDAGEWETISFEKLFSILSNNTLSRAELSIDGEGIYNIHYGDILIKYPSYVDIKETILPVIKDASKISNISNVRLQDGDIVIADTAEDEIAGKCIEIGNVKNKVVVAGLHTIPCRPNKRFALAYLGYYLNSNAFHSALLPIMQGSKVTSISRSALKKIIITYPLSIEEQRKIADCLLSIDDNIVATTKKLEQLKIHKKALLQKLFPQRGKTTPELRFPEFQKAGAWEEKTLGDVFMRIKDKNKKNNKNILTISARYGLISQYEFFHKNVAAIDVLNYYLIKRNDFAYNKSRSQGYPYGAIKSLKLYEDGVVSPLYICFRLKNNDYNNDFFEQYFGAELINYEIEKMAQEGARHHGLLNISTYDFFNKVLLFVPSPSEQNKIAACLRSIDEDIIFTTQKIGQLKNHKNALLQQLFVNKQSYNMPN